MTLGTSVATSGAERTDPVALDLLERVAAQSGPTFDVGLLEAAVGLFPSQRTPGQLRLSAVAPTVVGLGYREGRTFWLEAGPGLVKMGRSDLARDERALERATADRMARVVLEAGRVLEGRPARSASRGVILEWSSRSRSRMLEAFAAVDWTSLVRAGTVLAMVTLTYPGQWETLAPSGRHAKRHLQTFRRRWRDVLGWRLDGAWKLEFQRRGAPHFHLLVPVPAMVRGRTFETWLSLLWADVVKAEHCGCDLEVQSRRGLPVAARCMCPRATHVRAGTGVDFSKTGRFTDPNRMAVYFAKHGTKTLDDKEYQHLVPPLWQLPGMGPGRFWGMWGLPRATRRVELDAGDFFTARRTVRRVAQARARRIAYGRARRAALEAGRSPDEATRLAVQARGRTVRSLGAGGALNGGWVLVHDGTGVASAVARAVLLRRSLD